MCIQVRRLSLGLGPSLSVYSVCRLLGQQLRLVKLEAEIKAPYLLRKY